MYISVLLIELLGRGYYAYLEDEVTETWVTPAAYM